MKNFKKLWTKKTKDEHGNNKITCWQHIPTMNLLYEHQHERWGISWRKSEEQYSGRASLAYWINEFQKHPRNIGR